VSDDRHAERARDYLREAVDAKSEQMRRDWKREAMDEAAKIEDYERADELMDRIRCRVRDANRGNRSV
jgi:outer membrane PBP1 activator LpoA protein